MSGGRRAANGESLPAHSPTRRSLLAAFLLILLIAAAFRLIALQDIPPGLSQDEVLNADIVSFIRQGKHALFFREGYGHEPLYHYFAVPFQVLLGDNVLSIRLPAAFLGLLLVAATMRWAKRDFGWQTAVIAGFGLAVGWQAVIFSRIGIRPIMEPLLLVGMAWFWTQRPSIAGLFLGLSLYTYTGARVVFAIPVLFGLVQGIVGLWRRRKGGDWEIGRLKSPLIIFIVAVLVYLPLYFTLQADPSLQERVRQLAGPLTALRDGDLQPILQTTLATLGAFSFTGDPRWTYTIAERPLMDWATAVFFYVGLAVAIWRIRRSAYTLALVWLAVGILPSAVTPDAPSIIRMVGALPIIFLLPAIALTTSFRALRGMPFLDAPRRANKALIILYALLLTLHTAYAFAVWPKAEETHYKYQTILQEMGRHWDANPAGAMVVVENFVEPIDVDSLRRNMNYDPAARWVQTGAGAAGAIVLPAGGDGRLYIPEYAAPHPALLTAADVEERSLHRSDQRPSFAVYPLPLAPDIPLLPNPILFDDKISLLGYEFGEQTAVQLELFTWWRVESTLPADLAAFVHLIDADGALIAQHDGLDAAPATLRAGDLIVQRHTLPLPSDLPNGYTVQAGLYTRGNGRRLTRNGNPSDAVILTENQ